LDSAFGFDLCRFQLSFDRDRSKFEEQYYIRTGGMWNLKREKIPLIGKFISFKQVCCQTTPEINTYSLIFNNDALSTSGLFKKIFPLFDLITDVKLKGLNPFQRRQNILSLPIS